MYLRFRRRRESQSSPRRELLVGSKEHTSHQITVGICVDFEGTLRWAFTAYGGGVSFR